jgi:phosphoglycolate phosphatase-like HAD superfamily hydrolase
MALSREWDEMLKAVIFDVDGTLVDSVDGHARAWVEAFAKFGRKIEFARMRHQIGKGGDQLMKEFLSKSEIEEFGKQLEKERGRIFQCDYLPFVTGFPFVRELFQRLLADGKKVVLASSAKGEELKTCQEKAHIEDLVQEQTSKDDAEKSKPHPDIFEAALGKLEGVSADEAIVVGDTPWDAIAAKRAGLRTVGVLCGGFPESELRDAGCVAIFRDPEDLLVRYEGRLWRGR